MAENVIAVILGGGAGSRLFPLTRERSKPAVPLGGKYRLIDVPVSNCLNSGVTQIFVLTQYNSASLNRHISQTYRFSTFSSGFVEILAAEQRKDSPDWFQGTADAVRQIFPHLRDWRISTLLILSGDHLYRMDYRKFLDRHFEREADVTISVIPARAADAEGFGILKADGSGRITEFREKPTGDRLDAMRVDTTAFGLTQEESEARPFLASMGIYVFNYPKLIELLEEDTARVDFGGEIIPAAIDRYNVQAFLFNNYWEDIGSIRAFYESNLDLASPLPKFNFFDSSAPIYTRSRHLPPSKLHSCDIDNSMVTEGCILNGVYARNSIIGLRSRLDPGVRLENSIVMGSDFYESFEEVSAGERRGVPHVGIGSNSVVRQAIVDKNVRIGRGVKLLNQASVQNMDDANGRFFIRDGIIVVPKNATLADGTEV
ncbi:MAG: glucose-1-phosphate adenylyltransferase [Acidobacteria bacterium]|nr:glucose-1-phosphate adenylyltransferase [Acidobacteriota bacterium]MCA1608685.1 glucose-1-phosphate adenylyltransferase [Acidobacteriota bacterium]